MTLQICIAQLNFAVGDMFANAQKIIDAAFKAHAQGADLLVTPELALCGYPAEDLLLRPAFMSACEEALNQVAQKTAGLAGLTLVVGHPKWTAQGDRRGRSVSQIGRFNAASVIVDGHIQASYAKHKLPNYQVFDESRYFQSGELPLVIELKGIHVGLLICEDAWFDEPAFQAKASGAQMLVVLNASPFHEGKAKEREEHMAERAKTVGLPMIHAHMVGGQDEIIFDGASFGVSAEGRISARAAFFEEKLFFVQVQSYLGAIEIEAEIEPLLSSNEELWRALVLGVRDYVEKNRFPSVVLGLSGGIDSAVVLAIAVDALGAKRVRAVMMPSDYTANISLEDAREMAGRLGVAYQEIAISGLFESFKQALAPSFAGCAADTTEENLQARIRGNLLMALSNKFGALVLTTGNKSELTTGYCTLYGDMAGGFGVIKDVVKTRVFELAWWRNQHDVFATGTNPIPERIITRPPSAELRPDQKDQDSLPPYEVLDAILQRYVEEDCSAADIIKAGFDAQAVHQVIRLLRINEYKRRQAAVGVRVTHRSFGKDWRYPITNGFRV